MGSEMCIRDRPRPAGLGRQRVAVAVGEPEAAQDPAGDVGAEVVDQLAAQAVSYKHLTLPTSDLV